MVRGHLVTGAVIAAATVLGLGQTAKAAYVTVDLSPYVDSSFAPLIDAGAMYPVGATTTGETGVPFSIANVGGTSTTYGLSYWGGGFGGVPADNGTTLTIPVDIANATTAYTLINNTYGTAGDTPTTVEFITSGGESLTFILAEGTDTRDYNDDGFINTIAPPTTEWFNTNPTGPDDGSSSQQRLDQQTYDLSSLLGDGPIVDVDVTSAPICAPPTMSDPCPPGGAFGGENTIFAGLTFLTSPPATSVPEPASLALLVTSLLGFGAFRRRRM